MCGGFEPVSHSSQGGLLGDSAIRGLSMVGALGHGVGTRPFFYVPAENEFRESLENLFFTLCVIFDSDLASFL